MLSLIGLAIFSTLNDLELEDPVNSPFQFLEALNQEDLAFRVFLLQIVERPVA